MKDRSRRHSTADPSPVDLPEWERFAESTRENPRLHAVRLERGPAFPVGESPALPPEPDRQLRERENRTLLETAAPLLEGLSLGAGGRPHVVRLSDAMGRPLRLLGTPEAFADRWVGMEAGGSAAGSAEAVVRFGGGEPGGEGGAVGFSVPIRTSGGANAGTLEVLLPAGQARPEILAGTLAGVSLLETALATAGPADPVMGLLSALMHDLRNSLSAIQVLTQLGTRRGGDVEQQEYFRKIEEQVRVVLDLLRVLREVMTPEAFAPVSVPGLLREAAQEALQAGRAPGVQLEWHQSGECRLPLRAALFRRAALALLRRAVVSIPEGGRLTVGAVCRPDGAELIITGTGPGIPPEAREDFFRPFNRSPNGENGLEIYLAWLVFTRLLRGEVLLEPVQSHGTLFRIHLPLV